MNTVASQVLIVDDEPDVAEMLRRILAMSGRNRVETAVSAEAALDFIERVQPELVLTDLFMPGMNGVELMKAAREKGCAAAFVVVSAYSTIENAVEAIRAGASDFLPKPFEPRDVELVLARLRRELEASRDAARLRQTLADSDPGLVSLIGRSRPMADLRMGILRAREVTANVLLEGDTGTGKELVARALHTGDGPFVAVNVAAIPRDIAETELFGHKAGAFSGASRDRKGLMSEADGGTLFLDEINGMDMALQAKVLRALEEKSVRPVGANREVAANFRLVAAANEPLERLVEEGRFRRDLFHRLHVLHFRLPPLTERREDIPALAQAFLLRYASAHGRRARRFSVEALEWLQAQPWPGNVRELENFVERLVIFSDHDRIELGVEVPGSRPGVRDIAGPDFLLRPTLSLEAVEQLYVNAVLRHTGGNKTRAAQILDIDYKTLLRKIERGRGADLST